MYRINQPTLLGASISRPIALGFRHRGTCADPACMAVVDTMPETGARLALRSAFSAGRPVTVDSIGRTVAEQQLRAARALSYVNRLPYAKATCDELATYAETGVPASPQLRNALVLALIAGIVLFG